MKVQNRGTFPKVIDSTIRSDFVDCHTKGYWGYFRKLGPNYPQIDLIAGGAFARGLEVTRLSYYDEGLPFAKALERGMLAAIAEYGPVTPPDNKLTKGVDRVVTCLAEYFKRYPVDKDELQPFRDRDGKPAIEFTFAIPLPILHPDTGEPLLYGGRFDMLATRRAQLLWDDEKTVSQLGPSWKNKWHLRGQFIGYTWACLNYSLPVIGGMVRGCAFYKQTPAHPTGHDFQEQLILTPPWLVDQWYEQLIWDIEAMKEAYIKGEYRQAFGEACVSYGGCPFQRLCLSQNPEEWIAPHYSENEWNPLKKNPVTTPEEKTEIITLEDLLAESIRRKIEETESKS